MPPSDQTEPGKLPDAARPGWVTDPDEAARLLARLRHQRNLLVVRIATDAVERMSLLLRVDATQGYLVLDALTPPPADGPVPRGARLHAHSHLDGVPLGFVAEVDALLDQGDDEPQLLLRWPTRLHHDQRRQDFRVSVPATLVPEQARLSLGEHSQRARLVDLSASGVAVLINSAPRQMKRGEIYACRLPLPDGEAVELGFEVTNVRRARGGQRVGGRVLPDDEAQRERILRAIMRIERWWLQQRRGD